MVGIGQFPNATGVSDHTAHCRQSTHNPSDISFDARIFLRRKLLAKIEARSITVFLDACFSGNSAGGMLVRATLGISVTPWPAETSTKLTVLTAAQGDQVASWDEEAKHGLFTEHLLRALYGGADAGAYGNGDGVVTLGEVENYLNDEMTYRARRRYGREQNATVLGDPGAVLAAYGPEGPPRRPRITAYFPGRK